MRTGGEDDCDEGEVGAAAYIDDEDAEPDEEAAARIADLYAQLELKRRQIAQMEAEFSDAETDDREENGVLEDYDDYDGGDKDDDAAATATSPTATTTAKFTTRTTAGLLAYIIIINNGN